MDKILSISIAAYNAEKDLRRCLDSFLCSSVVEKLEIIVVDDGSQDETAAIAKQYVDKYPTVVKLISKKNGGHGSTINASLQQATGIYYKVVDSDDWVDCDGLERLVNWLSGHTVDLVLTPYERIDANKIEVPHAVIPYDASQRIAEILPIDKAGDINVYMHSITYKTDVVQKMGPIIDENCFYVDMEYAIYPMLYIHNYACLDVVVYEYLCGTATQSMSVQNMVKRRNQHLQVVHSLLRFWNTERSEIQQGAYRIVQDRIREAILTQYKIYANMPSNEAYREVREFDAWLQQYSDIYDGPRSRFMQLIYWNRRTKFKFYKVTLCLLKLFHMQPAL